MRPSRYPSSFARLSALSVRLHGRPIVSLRWRPDPRPRLPLLAKRCRRGGRCRAQWQQVNNVHTTIARQFPRSPPVSVTPLTSASAIGLGFTGAILPLAWWLPQMPICHTTMTTPLFCAVRQSCDPWRGSLFPKGRRTLFARERPRIESAPLPTGLPPSRRPTHVASLLRLVSSSQL